MTVKLLTEDHLEFLRLKGGCTGSSESTHDVKMPRCWKSDVMAFMFFFYLRLQEEVPVTLLSACQMARYLYDMALDTFDK